jgi:hypothetical protein
LSRAAAPPDQLDHLAEGRVRRRCRSAARCSDGFVHASESPTRRPTSGPSAAVSRATMSTLNSVSVRRGPGMCPRMRRVRRNSWLSSVALLLIQATRVIWASAVLAGSGPSWSFMEILRAVRATFVPGRSARCPC